MQFVQTAQWWRNDLRQEDATSALLAVVPRVNASLSICSYSLGLLSLCCQQESVNANCVS